MYICLDCGHEFEWDLPDDPICPMCQSGRIKPPDPGGGIKPIRP